MKHSDTCLEAQILLYIFLDKIQYCRDFWSDEGVKDMVWCSFVFWQKMNITPEGETYIAYYKVHVQLRL